MKALIPVAGLGTRLLPLTEHTPKPLLKILNKPILQWSLEGLIANGLKEIIIVIAPGEPGEQVRKFVNQWLAEQADQAQIKIDLVIQEQPLGTAHVVQVAKDYFEPDEHFIFIYGDDIYGPGNIKLVLEHPTLCLLGQKVVDPEKWGILSHDPTGKFLNVVEKPQAFVGDLANIGCMKLSSRIFDLYGQLQLSTRGEYELTDSLNLLAQEQAIHVLTSTDYWLPIGYPWHILAATQQLITNYQFSTHGQIEPNVTIKGKLALPATSTIKSGTYIEGDIIVGENTVIGPNAYLRGANVVGNNCYIGQASEVKNCVIGDNSRLPHHIYLADSVLGNDVNLAAHTVVANTRHDGANIKSMVKGQLVDTGLCKLGTVIGDHVKTGIGTLIYPGRKLAAHATTLPGEIVSRDK